MCSSSFSTSFPLFSVLTFVEHFTMLASAFFTKFFPYCCRNLCWKLSLSQEEQLGCLDVLVLVSDVNYGLVFIQDHVSCVFHFSVALVDEGHFAASVYLHHGVGQLLGHQVGGGGNPPAHPRGPGRTAAPPWPRAGLEAAFLPSRKSLNIYIS